MPPPHRSVDPPGGAKVADTFLKSAVRLHPPAKRPPPVPVMRHATPVDQSDASELFGQPGCDVGLEALPGAGVVDRHDDELVTLVEIGSEVVADLGQPRSDFAIQNAPSGRQAAGKKVRIRSARKTRRLAASSVSPATSVAMAYVLMRGRPTLSAAFAAAPPPCAPASDERTERRQRPAAERGDRTPWCAGPGTGTTLQQAPDERRAS